jgi:hypothetical protein
MESKNIHVLQTDKPSRLLRKGKELLLVEIPKIYTFFGNTVSVNIYITSDEEIKEGNWVYFISTKEVVKVPIGVFKGNVCKKIILTTDLELIDDGVQCIDDEFLEWFVKNPSCDKTKHVIKEYVDNQDAYGYDVNYYKIITIEEPKQLEKRMYSSEDMKQAWEDGRNGETECVGSYPFYATKFKNKTFSDWFKIKKLVYLH